MLLGEMSLAGGPLMGLPVHGYSGEGTDSAHTLLRTAAGLVALASGTPAYSRTESVVNLRSVQVLSSAPHVAPESLAPIIIS